MLCPMRLRVLVLVACGLAFAASAVAAPPRSQRSKRPLGASAGDGGSAARVDVRLQARLRATPLAVRTEARVIQVRLATSDPVLLAWRDRANTARTNEVKYEAWSAYNTRLYGEMRRRAPALREHINLLEKIARGRFEPPPRRGEGIDSAGFDRAET